MSSVSRGFIGGRFRLIEQIAQGGMGTVYKGVDTHTDDLVAIKWLRPEAIGSDPGMIERFIREGEALRQLNHPNIVKMLGAVEEQGNHYLIVEYMSGGDLHSLIRREERLSVKRTLEIALDLADALTRAHRLHIIHRDLKPANVLIAEDGTPRLTDFGVAYLADKRRVTGTGSAVGTFDYIAPEVLTGELADARSDIWALGLIIFEMLAGKHPFDRSSMGEALIAIMSEPVPDLEQIVPQAPVALVDLIYRMLEKKPQARISSIRQIGAELEALLSGHSTSTLRLLPREEYDDPRFATPTPLSSGTLPQNNLPVQPTPFVGRDKELNEMLKLLTNPAIRLITVVAPGGMGKTRLALEAARRQLHNFRDGVFYVPLAALTQVENIIPAIAEAVGYRFEVRGESPEQQLINYLDEKNILLILDNFEHLLDGARWISMILQQAPRVRVLVCSYEKLNLSSETLFHLSGMEFPDGKSSSSIMDFSATHLFLQGAQRARPGFELRHDDFPHLARIFRVIQGMPLGILLAASWVEMLSLEEISKEISQSVDFLASEHRDLPERQRSIRAVFNKAWDLLTDAEQNALMGLAVFRGGFTRQAAQQVTGVSLQTLMSLGNKSWFTRDPISGRYEIQELLRQFIEEQLVRVGKEADTRAAHASYYVDMMQRFEPDLQGRRQLGALDEIEVEFENVRAAWSYAIQQRQFEAIGQAQVSLALFCNMRSRLQEASDLFNRAREGLAPLGDAPHTVWALIVVQCEILHRTFDRAALTNSLQIAEQNLDLRTIGFCYWTLGVLESAQRQFEQALAHFETSRACFERGTEPYWLAWTLDRIGGCYRAMGYEDEALQASLDCLTLRQQLGDLYGQARALNIQATAKLQVGNYEEAEAYWNETLKIQTQINHRVGIGLTSGSLSLMAFLRGDYARSKALAETTRMVGAELNHRNCKAYAGVLLGNNASMEGDYAGGKRMGQDSLRVGTQDPWVSIDADWTVSLGACGLKDYTLAHIHNQKCLKFALDIGGTAFMAWNLPVTAILLDQRGDKQGATEALALAFNYPLSVTGWMEKWELLTQLRKTLENDLGKKGFQTAWSRGKALNLETAVKRWVE